MPRPYSPQPAKCKAVEDGEHCTRRVHCHGYCNIHYGRMYRHGSLEKMAAGKPKESATRCTVPNCNRPSHAKKLCGIHYGRMQHHGTFELLNPAKVGRPRRRCEVIGCYGPIYQKGMCCKHYWREKKYGSTDLPPGVTPRRSPLHGNAAWRRLSDDAPRLKVDSVVVTMPAPAKFKLRPRPKCENCHKKIKVGQSWSADGTGYRHRWCAPRKGLIYPVHFFETFSMMRLHRATPPGLGTVV